MNTENRIEVNLFGETVTLKYGLRSSRRMRQLCPDTSVLKSMAPEDLLILAIKSALPESLQSKSDDDLIDEIDNLDPLLINKAFNAFQDNAGFFVKALTGESAKEESKSPELPGEK